jgi:DUF1009 family protein
MPAEAPAPLGLIAGNGVFPILFAQAAKKAGHRVVAVGHVGETDAGLADHVDTLHWVRVGQLGALIGALRKHGVMEAAMAGGIDKRRLFSHARPDWLGVKTLARLLGRRDDALLRAVAHTFECHHITIVPSTRYMPEAMTPAGVLGTVQPTSAQWLDLREGLRIAHVIGTLDIGQTVVLRDGAVVALEAIEGTDACIHRAGTLTHQVGAVVVKAAKPQQDMRFDVPAVGLKTLQAAHDAGVKVMGLEAGRTLMLNPQALIEAANTMGISLVGLEDGSRG